MGAMKPLDFSEPSLGNELDNDVDPSIARKRRIKMYVWMGRLALAAVVLVGWQLMSPHVSQLIFSSPFAIAASLPAISGPICGPR